MPVFLVGDMNSPSHLDWTPAVAAVRPQVAYPLAWPVSKALAGAGFRDSYRDAHPDPVARPGLTWTPGTPPPLISADETLDRIDWVMAAGPAPTLASRLVGELGGPDVDVGLERWGSDHRAVASTFDAEPGRAPRLVDAEPRVARAGQTLTIRYTTTSGGAGRRIGVLPAHGRRPIVTLPIARATDHLPPSSARARSGPGVLPGGAAGRARPDPGDIAVLGASTRGAPAHRRDQAQLRGRRADPAALAQRARQQARLGRHLPRRPARRLRLPRLQLPGRAPAWAAPASPRATSTSSLKPGRYVAGLFLDDGYSLLARTSFRVR